MLKCLYGSTEELLNCQYEPLLEVFHTERGMFNWLLGLLQEMCNSEKLDESASELYCSVRSSLSGCWKGVQTFHCDGHDLTVTIARS